jgi:hypothetical protein
MLMAARGLSVSSLSAFRAIFLIAARDVNRDQIVAAPKFVFVDQRFKRRRHEKGCQSRG